jgi:hypothetical protein
VQASARLLDSIELANRIDNTFIFIEAKFLAFFVLPCYGSYRLMCSGKNKKKQQLSNELGCRCFFFMIVRVSARNPSYLLRYF